MASRPRSTTSPRTPRPFRWTRTHLARLPDDGNRYEVLDGRLLVTPQARPRHQDVALRLAMRLAAFCDQHQIGKVVGPGAVVWNKNELQPDVQVIPGITRIEDDATWDDFPFPILVIEVLSPGHGRYDRGVKRDAYLKLGIAEYWIVDIEARAVEVSRPGAPEPAVEHGTLTWRPTADAPALDIDVAKLLS